MQILDSRVPTYERVGAINPDSVRTLADFSPLNLYFDESFTREGFMRDYSGRPEGEIQSAAQSIARVALDHYDNTHDQPADTVQLTMHRTKGKRFKAENWHRDTLFPGEALYALANYKPTEFATGEGVTGLNVAPNVVLNSLVNKLITTKALLVASGEVNELVAFTGKNIHRRPYVPRSEPRFSLVLALYSRSYAQEICGNSALQRMKYRFLPGM